MPGIKAQIRLRIYVWARRLFAERQSVLLRVHNGQTKDSFAKTLNTKSLAEGEVLLNPVQVYQLRWMVGKQAGLPEFEPPFVLVE